MIQSKHTKRALLASVLSVVACCALLIGSTFAWFTDEVTSGNNKIVAGNLDVELEYYDTAAKAWKPVEGETALFDATDLWEPGFTQVAYFRITNQGSLALKYQFGTNVLYNKTGTSVRGNEIDLSKLLRFGIVEKNGETDAFATRGEAIEAVEDTAIDFTTFSVAGDLTKTGETDYLAMVVYLPEGTGNEANHNGKDIPSIDFGVSVAAAQAPVEKDSFDERYDASAQYPEIVFDGYEVQTPAEDFEKALDLVQDGGTIIVNGAVHFAKSIAIDKNVTIRAGSAGAIFTGSPLHIGEKVDVTLDGLTFVDPTNGTTDNASAVYAAKHAGKLTVQNCTFRNCKWEGLQITPVNGAEIVITGNTFENDPGFSGHRYLHIEYTGEANEEKRPAGAVTDARITVKDNRFGPVADLGNSAVDIDFVMFDHLTLGGNTFADPQATIEAGTHIYICDGNGAMMPDAYAVFTAAG